MNKNINEDVPTNAASPGNVAGMGGASGEPGFNKKSHLGWKKKNKTFKRWLNATR